MERLSGIDAAFTYLETPNAHMHVAMTAIFDTDTMPEGYSFEAIKRLIRERMHLVAPFRRRLVTVPFNLNHPIWIEDPDFDLDFHIHRVTAPEPGGRRELADLAARIASVPLDRNKPLWEIWVIEGLKQNRVGVVTKVHHSAIDGASGAEIMTTLYDLAPEGTDIPPPEPHEPEHIPNEWELIGYAMSSRVKRLIDMPALLGRTVGNLSNVVSNRMSDDSGPRGALPLTAPPTPFNSAITPHRRVGFARVPLSGAKEIKEAFGVKVNDVVLAIMSGTLRKYLDDRGDLPDESLVACIPVSVRTDDEKGAANNRVSAMFAHLSTHVEDPTERLRLIADSTKGAKEEHNALGARMMTDWGEYAAPRTFQLASRLYSQIGMANMHRPIHNLVISNVPGPPFPLYFAGAKLVAAYPMGPIMEGAGMNVTVLSYEDNIDVGFMVDRDLTPDVWDLANAVEAAYEELLDAARAVTTGGAPSTTAAAQQAPAKQAATKKAPAKKAPAKKAAPKQAPAKKAATKKAPAKKAPAKKAAAKKAAAKKAPAKRKAPAKKAASTKAPAKQAPAKRKAPAKKAAATKAPAKRAPATRTAPTDARVTERGATVRTARKKPSAG
ncbi:MAG: wax ester/triacylglycerol synthase family O-acyltransferase [Microthrixaceae bacterium]